MSRIIGEDVAWRGRWLMTKYTHWQDPDGKKHVWESVERCNHGKAVVDGSLLLDAPRSSSAYFPIAVEVLAIIHKEDEGDSVILVKQFRPPVGATCLELPAGAHLLHPLMVHRAPSHKRGTEHDKNT